jgi:hypothetical protein
MQYNFARRWVFFFFFFFSAVIFEGNAQEVVKARVNSNLQYFSRIGHFIKSIIHEVHYCSYSTFDFVSTTLNFAAHTFTLENF